MDPPSRVQSFYHIAMMPIPWLCTLLEEEEEEEDTNTYLLIGKSPHSKTITIYVLSSLHCPLERPPVSHPCLTDCGTIQSCCVPSSTCLTIDI